MLIGFADRPVRTIPVHAVATVDHKIHLGRTCGKGFAVASQDGTVSVLGDQLQLLYQADLGDPVNDFTATTTGDKWAWIMNNHLHIGERLGTCLMHEQLPQGPAACQWSSSAAALWAAVGTGYDVQVQIRTPQGRIRSELTVPDAFGDSAVTLHPHPNPDAVVLWIAAGQDGQQSWLIRDVETGLAAERLPTKDCLPAVFGPDGDWFLTADDDRMVRCTWPAPVTQSALEWADTTADPEDDGDGDGDGDGPGYDLVLLPGAFASWSTANGRIVVIDLSTMSIVDEIAMDGHPVRTMAEVYPALAGDDSLCTDFHFTVPNEDAVLSVHGEQTVVLSHLRDWSPQPDRSDRI